MDKTPNDQITGVDNSLLFYLFFFIHDLAQCKQSLLVHLPCAYSLPFEVFEFMNNRKRLKVERGCDIYTYWG